ncbi:hypothetical protein AgCh_012629 [Apium graveolens]
MVMLLCSQIPAKQDATYLLQTLDVCDCVVTVNTYLNLIIRRVHACHPSGGFVDHPSGSFVDHPPVPSPFSSSSSSSQHPPPLPPSSMRTIVSRSKKYIIKPNPKYPAQTQIVK